MTLTSNRYTNPKPYSNSNTNPQWGKLKRKIKLAKTRGRILSVSVWEREKTALDTVTEVLNIYSVHNRMNITLHLDHSPKLNPRPDLNLNPNTKRP